MTRAPDSCWGRDEGRTLIFLFGRGGPLGALTALVALAIPVIGLTAQRDAKSYETINEFATRGWAFDLGTSLTDLKAVGNVQREVVSTVKNRHDENQIDEVRELYYDGLYVRAYFPAKDHKRLFLEEVEITSARFRVKHGLNVGASVTELQRVLGQPDEVKGDVYSYFGEADTVHFVVRGGVIIKVKWELYLD
ncbi:MAG: hypothetical protein XU15_C0017G0017 [candidate division NC10 bacterium CSP1-5]|nr:MAG: hypothetical protein XU15_C0017G0017 [candidate division NC10 bacterium CSP1-5]